MRFNLSPIGIFEFREGDVEQKRVHTALPVASSCDSATDCF
jgi:hypothetical protein